MTLPQLPPPDEASIHVFTQGSQQGPFSRRDLQAKLVADEVLPTDSFWFAGMAEWVPISNHPDLLADVGGLPEPATPPPLPAAPAAEPAPAPAPEPALSKEEDDHLDAVFGELVNASWDYLKKHEFASQIDEVFLGAVITSSLDRGYSLIDLTSDGTHHYLRFENLNDTTRLVFRLRHLTGDLATAKVLGQQASVVLGYGEKAGEISKVISALKAEFKSGFIASPEPGTIAVDGDLTSGYVYTQVDMFWNIDDYVDAEYNVDHDTLALHIAACTNALRKYLRGRFA